MTVPEVFVVRDAGVLFDAVAARLVTRVVDRQAASGRARVLLGGDPLTLGVLRALAASPARDAIDDSALDLWWANDVWGPQEDPARASWAVEQVLRRGELTETSLHPIPGPEECQDAAEAAEQYALALRAARDLDDHGLVPRFDVLLLGIGPGGGVAGIAPEQPAAHELRAVTAVGGTPQHPGQVTLTGPALTSADEAWLVGAGDEVSSGVHLALSGAGAVQVPVAGVRGRQRTLLLLDEGAARRLPASMRRRASP